MLLKVAFDKIVFVKFKISNNFKQNIENLYQPMDIKNIKKKIREPVLRLLPNLCDFQEKPYPRVWI
jgi:hypothetical protein